MDKKKLKNNSFSERLKYIIDESGDNKKTFAKLCGISENQLYIYLKGTSEPGMKFLAGLKKQYPWVSLDWLISGIETPPIQSQKDPIIPIDPAVGMLIEVEKELNIELNRKQREAVIALLRRELDNKMNQQRPDIMNLISSFLNEV